LVRAVGAGELALSRGRAVVARQEYKGVIGNAQGVNLVQQPPNVVVQLLLSVTKCGTMLRVARRIGQPGKVGVVCDGDMLETDEMVQR
jgi:hypothetical protein